MSGSASQESKMASLASRKFDFEDMINADPACPQSALKIVRAYLRFITDFDKGTAFVSILDLQVATALSNRAIIDARKKLVELGYFAEAGKTDTGATKYRLVFARENIVLDHVAIAKETLKKMDAQRKETQRTKRFNLKSVSEECSYPVSEEATGTNHFRACENDTAVSEECSYKYLEEYLEGYSSEGEGDSQVAETDANQTYSAVDDDAHIPFEVPGTAQTAEKLLTEIFTGHQMNPAVFVYFRKKLFEGSLTPNDIHNYLRKVS